MYKRIEYKKINNIYNRIEFNRYLIVIFLFIYISNIARALLRLMIYLHCDLRLAIDQLILSLFLSRYLDICMSLSGCLCIDVFVLCSCYLQMLPSVIAQRSLYRGHCTWVITHTHACLQCGYVYS